MAAGDLVTRPGQMEIWRSDTDRLLMGAGTSYQWVEIDGIDVPAIRVNDMERPQGHGTIGGIDRYESRKLIPKLWVTGSPGSDQASKLHALAKAFRVVRPGEADPILTYWGKGSLTAKRLVGRPRRAAWNFNRLTALGATAAMVQFEAFDPRFYTKSETSKRFEIPADSTTASTTVTNLGDAETDAVLEIQGPLTNPRITNSADSNRQIKLDITLASNDILIVDIKNRSVKLGGVERYEAIRTDNQWFEILPGANLITFTRTTTTGVAALTIKFRDAFTNAGPGGLDFATLGGGTMVADYDASKLTLPGSGGVRVATWANQVAGQPAATQTDATKRPWASDRDFWLALPGAIGANATTPLDDANRTGNRLRRNQASLETSINGWLANGNCSISQSAAHAAEGTKSLLMTATAGGTLSAATLLAKSGIRVLPNTQYTALASFRAGQVVTTETCRADIHWYDAAGTFISTTFGGSTAFTNLAFTQATQTVTSPANAAYASVAARVANGVNAALYYVDRISLHAGASTTWTAGRDEDLDVRIKVAANSWSNGTYETLATFAGTSWALKRIGTTLQLDFSPDGTTVLTATSANLGLAAGATADLRVTLDIDDGLGNRVIKFFTSADGGLTWTQLGATITQAGVTTLFEGSILAVGSTVGGAQPLSGKIFSLDVRDQIDSTTSVRTNPNFEAANASGFSDETGNAWTLNGSATFGQGTVRGIEIRFNGTDEFLQLASLGPIKHVLVLAKYDGATFPAGVFPGLLNPTTNVGYILLGNAGTTNFFDEAGIITSYKYNGNIHPESSMRAPMNEYGVASISRDDLGWLGTTLLIGWNTGDRFWKGGVKRIVAFSSKLSETDEQIAIEELRRMV